MSNETEFVGGLIVKAPREGAPEFVKAKISIKREEMIAWLQGREGEWVNADVKESRNGKWYASVDDWKPEGGTSSSGARGGAPQRERPAAATNAATDDFTDPDIPFITSRGKF